MIPETALAFWLHVCMSVEAKVRRFQCWKGNWNMRANSVLAKKDYFQQEAEICPRGWGDVWSRSEGWCVIRATARARLLTREMLHPLACVRVHGSQFCKPMQAVFKEFAMMGQ